MEQVVEFTGERAEGAVAADEQVLELSMDALQKVGGGIIDTYI